MNKLTTRPIDAGVGIGHVHLKVADLDRALDFYCGVLGFELTQRYGSQAAFISAGGYHHHIGLNTWESAGGSPPPPGATGLYHLAILYPTRAALADALHPRGDRLSFLGRGARYACKRRAFFHRTRAGHVPRLEDWRLPKTGVRLVRPIRTRLSSASTHAANSRRAGLRSSRDVSKKVILLILLLLRDSCRII